jgi:hypothetical protein
MLNPALPKTALRSGRSFTGTFALSKLAFPLILVLVALVVFTATPTSDLTPRYVGAQAALRGQSPYSEATLRDIQIAYYGAVATEGQDQQRFAYPAYSLFIFTPLTVFPLTVAHTVWQLAQLALVLAALRRLGTPLVVGALLLIVLKEPVVNLLVGNLALWATAWIGFGLDALERKQERRAGVYFMLACIQPTLTIPLALFLLLPFRKALLTFVVGMGAVGIASVALWGWWIPDFLAGLRSYTTYVSYMVWLPALFPPVVVVALWSLVNGWRTDTPLTRYRYTLSALVLVMPLTGLYHLSLFLLARLPLRWWLVVGAVIWLATPLPFEARRFEVVLFAATVLIFTRLHR